MAISAEAVRIEIEQQIRNIVELFAGNGRKAALARAARALQMPERRVKQLFYGEARRIEAHEADNISTCIKAADKLLQARTQDEAQHRKFVESHSRYSLTARE